LYSLLILSGGHLLGQSAPTILTKPSGSVSKPISYPDGGLPDQLDLRVISTGKPSGIVFHLHLVNKTDSMVEFRLDPFIVPPTKKRQGYTVIYPLSGSIAPGTTEVYPVRGVCNDLHREPYPVGKEISNTDDWVFASDLPVSDPPGTIPDENSGFKKRTFIPDKPPNTFHRLTHPGTTVPFNYSIDLQKNTRSAAPILLESLKMIITTYDSLNDAGKIITPYETDSLKERETVIQHSYWIVTSLLEDEPYTFEEFRGTVISQFEETSRTQLNDSPTQVREEIENGAERFWDVFTLVGVEAKVFTHEEGYDDVDVSTTASDSIDNCCIRIEQAKEQDQATTEAIAENRYVGITFKEPEEGKNNHVRSFWNGERYEYTYTGGKPSGYRQCILPDSLMEDFPSLDIGVFEIAVYPDYLCCLKGEECIVHRNLDLWGSFYTSAINQQILSLNWKTPNQTIHALPLSYTGYVLREHLMDRAGLTTRDPEKAKQEKLCRPDWVIDGKVIFSCCEEEGKEGMITYSMEVLLIDPVSSEVKSRIKKDDAVCHSNEIMDRISMHEEIQQQMIDAFSQFWSIISKQ
jgi:hypothetical protein